MTDLTLAPPLASDAAPIAAARGDVVADRVGYEFNGVAALSETSLSVRAGEFFTLLGPSGSGKTTLLRLIAGLLDLEHGSISIDGRDVSRVPTQNRDIGFVFQNYALFPHLTVAENIEFGLKLRKMSATQRRTRRDEMIDLVALGALADRHPAELSGGQQQRVALARALAQRPRVLLLDEPLGALDRRLRQELGAEVRRIQQEAQTTAIYVTHDQEEAFILSDRMGVMDHGRIVQVGTPEEIYHGPADLFVGKFLGEANLFGGVVVSTAARETVVRVGTTDVRCRPNPDLSPGDAATLCIRPEQMSIEPPAAAGGSGLDSLGTRRVADVRFLGQSHRLRLRPTESRASAASETPDCLVDLGPAAPIPVVGSEIHLAVRPGTASAFSAVP